MARNRTIHGKRYGVRPWLGEGATVDSCGLNGSIAYAMQRHHETGRPYLVGWYGHVLVDCRENRALMREEEMGGIACVTVC